MSYQAIPTVKGPFYIGRIGFMLSKRDIGDMHGELGSAGREVRLVVWRNPKKEKK